MQTPDWHLKTVPYSHQVEAFNRSKDLHGFAYLMEMGTGKTAVCLANIAYLIKQERLDCIVVVAPKGVYLNWPNRELKVHWPDDIALDIRVWPKQLDKKVVGNATKVIFINVEALSSSEKAVDWLFKEIKNLRTFLAVDESSCAKNTKSSRSKVLANLGKHCLFKRIMTGSPITQSPLDIFSQVNIILPVQPTKAWDFTSFTHFKMKYAVQRTVKFGFKSFQQIVGYKNLDDLQMRLDQFSFRVKKEDCLDLPTKIYELRNVELSDEQRKVYNNLVQDGYHIFGDKEKILPQQALSLLQKLRQVLCGFVINTDTETTTDIKNGRIDEVLDVCEEMQGQVVIWSTWRKSLKDISSALVKKYGEDQVTQYWGDTNDEQREEGLRRFTGGEARFLVANPATGGFGLTLTNCHNVIYFNNGFSLEQRIQSEDRCHRIGQKHPVTYVDIAVPDSVDFKILKALLAKQDLAAQTIGDDWKEWIKLQ